MAVSYLSGDDYVNGITAEERALRDYEARASREMERTFSSYYFDDVFYDDPCHDDYDTSYDPLEPDWVMREDDLLDDVDHDEHEEPDHWLTRRYFPTTLALAVRLQREVEAEIRAEEDAADIAFTPAYGSHLRTSPRKARELKRALEDREYQRELGRMKPRTWKHYRRQQWQVRKHCWAQEESLKRRSLATNEQPRAALEVLLARFNAYQAKLIEQTGCDEYC